MSNPLSGHMAANSFAGSSGLRDGDSITSPSLTNLYEAHHGNGIIRGEDFAIGATNRNAVGSSSPGHVSVTAGGVVTVQGGYVSIDGALYSFAGGPGGSATFTIGTTVNYQNGNGVAPTVSGLPNTAVTELWAMVYITSNNANSHLMYELGNPVNPLTSTPQVPANFLTSPHVATASFSNHQHVPLAAVRMTIAANQSSIPGGFTSSEVHDKRCYYRQTPIFFVPGTGGALGNVATTNAVDGNNNKTLDNIYSGNEAGDLSASPFGALWQSFSPVDVNKVDSTANAKLYYSAKRGDSRITHRLGPNECEIDTPTAATATITCTDGDAAHGLTAGQKITLTSTDGTKKDYFVSDTGDGGVAHLSAVTAGATLKSTGSITATLSSGATGISVGFNLASGTQNAYLVLLKAAIEHANGHNGKITVSSVPGAADGYQNITVTQATVGHAGNTVITEDLASVTASGFFSGGESVAADTFTFDGANIFIKDPTAGSLTLNPSGVFPNGHVVELRNDASGGSNTVTFDTTGLNYALAIGKYARFVYHGTKTAATATISVADGDALVTAGTTMAEKQAITLVSTDNTTKTYVVVDDNATTVTTGTVLTASSDTGASTAGALAGGIAVAVNTTGSVSTQNAFLVQLKAAIEHANGHNGKITVSSVPSVADGSQSITLTQATVGAAGNNPITEDLGPVTVVNFAGGLDGWRKLVVGV